MIDFSNLVDRYEKDNGRLIFICSLQFSPDGRLLAIGRSDSKISVRSLEMIFFSVNTVAVFRYGISLINEHEPCSKITRTPSLISLSYLTAVLSSLGPWISQFAYGIYGMDRQRSCQ